MSKLQEDQSGWDDKFVNNQTSPVLKLTTAALNAAKRFSDYKKAEEARLQKIKDAEAARTKAELDRAQKKADRQAEKDREYAEREELKRQRRQAKKQKALDDARAQRKENRDRREREKREDAANKAAELRDRMKDGHIMDINYKFKYRELLLTFASSTLQELYDSNKIEIDVLPKMFKYGKSIESLLQKYPGSLVTSIRQHKFNQHPGMQALTAKHKGQNKSEDGPYRLIHPLFSPKRGASELVIKTLMSEYAKNVMFVDSGFGSIGNSFANAGFSPQSCVWQFDQILKATGVGTVDYIVIGWYNSTYESVKNNGLTIRGTEDQHREFPENWDSPVDDWGKTDHTKELEMKFPLQFFTEFSEIFEMVRVENMKTYTKIEELIRHAGINYEHHENDTGSNDVDGDGGYL